MRTEMRDVQSRFVRMALMYPLGGGQERAYVELIRALKEAQTCSVSLTRWVSALTSGIAEHPITESHKPLFVPLFDVRCIVLSGDAIAQVIKLYKALVSRNSIYVLPAVHWAVRNFSLLREEEERIEAKNNEAADYIGLLCTFLSDLEVLCPSSSTFARSILREYAPSQNRSTCVHQTYYRSVLEASKKILGLRVLALDLTFERLLDLEIALKHKKEAKTKGKYDAILHLVQECVSHGSSNESYSWLAFQATMKSWDTALARKFESTVLLHFILDFCNLSFRYVEMTLRVTLENVLDPCAAEFRRKASLTCFTSVLLSGTFVRYNTVVYYVSLLLEWLESYCALFSEPAICSGGQEHSVFYAVCDKAFYIILSKLRLETLEDLEDIIEPIIDSIQHIIDSNLHPLQRCSEDVVNRFHTLDLNTNAHKSFV